MYLRRHLEEKILELAPYFKIILVRGARQVGKSTLLGHLFPEFKHIIFDPIQDIYGARRDPDLFLDNYPPPLILDEIQYAPELLPALKRRVDQQQNGQYFLTDSQNLSVLKNVSESLAGRVGILELDALSIFEITQHFENWIETYLTAPETLSARFSHTLPLGDKTLFDYLWRGGLPGTLGLSDEAMTFYFKSYLETYIERDVRLLENIRDLHLFERFLNLAAMLTSQEINHSQIGRELGISASTADRWLKLLMYSFQWREIWPYHGNAIKRISKKTKGYITDTGLACYLQNIFSKEALARNARQLGALFETYCVNMLMQYFSGHAFKPGFYH